MKARRVALAAELVLAAPFVVAVATILADEADTSDVAADAAIVLGAAVYDTEPSPVFAARIDHAIDLYRAGRVARVLFTGGVGPGDTLAEGDAARAYAVARGVAEADILVERTSRITEENLRNARDVAERAGVRTFLVVSDPLHLPRSMRMARDLGMDAWPAPTPYTRYRTWRTRVPFLAREAWFYVGYVAAGAFPGAPGR